MAKYKGFYLTYEAYEKLTKARLGVECEYCKKIDEATPKSPRKKYNFCPMCGRYRKEVE